jgi:hypothetical protein
MLHSTCILLTNLSIYLVNFKLNKTKKDPSGLQLSDRPLATRRAVGSLFVCTHHCPSHPINLTIVPQHTSKLQMKQIAEETEDSTELSRPRSRMPCHYRCHHEKPPYIWPVHTHLHTPPHSPSAHSLTSQTPQTNLYTKKKLLISPHFFYVPTMRSLDAADLSPSPYLRDTSRRYQGLTYNCVSVSRPSEMPYCPRPPRRVDSALDMRVRVPVAETGSAKAVSGAVSA